MKLISAKQKTFISTPAERINFSNEIEKKTVSGFTTYRLSDFNSDIIYFSCIKSKVQTSLNIICDRPYRKYTFIAKNDTDFEVDFNFIGDQETIAIYSNSSQLHFKTGTGMIIDLYQTAAATIHLVLHTTL